MKKFLLLCTFVLIINNVNAQYFTKNNDDVFHLNLNDSFNVYYKLTDKPLSDFSDRTADSLFFNLNYNSFSIYIPQSGIQFFVNKTHYNAASMGQTFLSFIEMIRKMNYYVNTNAIIYIKN